MTALLIHEMSSIAVSGAPEAGRTISIEPGQIKNEQVEGRAAEGSDIVLSVDPGHGCEMGDVASAVAKPGEPAEQEESKCCFAALRLMIMGFTIAAMMELILFMCPELNVISTVLHTMAALGAGALLAGLIMHLICSCSDLPCGWGYLATWQSGLAASIILARFIPCCGGYSILAKTLIILVVLGVAVAAFLAWVNHCKEITKCDMYLEFSVVLLSIAFPVLEAMRGILAFLPLDLSACIAGVSAYQWVLITFIDLAGLVFFALWYACDNDTSLAFEDIDFDNHLDDDLIGDLDIGPSDHDLTDNFDRP